MQVCSLEAKATEIMAPVLLRKISVEDAVVMAIGRINVQPHQGEEDEDDAEDVGDEGEELQAPDNRPR